VLGNLGNCHKRLGDFRQALDLFTQALAITRDTGDRQGEGAALGNLAACHYRLGEYRQALDLHTQALAIKRATGNRAAEGNALADVGLCHYRLGDYRQALDLLTQSLAIARDIGDRSREANALAYLGWAWLASDDARRAVTLLEQAISVADAIGDIKPGLRARSGLAQAQLQLGDPAAALAAAAAGRELPYPAEEPAMRLLEGLALLGLHRVDEAERAFSDTVTAADALLALADSNVVALQARALALSGLAAATGDPAWATQAVQAFARAPAITSAAGVAADTRRLLDAIASHDQSGILAEVLAAQDS
jgi:tetratricopeptide (TPR) repeat protein